MRLDELAGLRVAILGYGREGRAAEALLSARSIPAAVFTGDASPEDPARHYAGLPDAAALAEFDVLIRSPGISPYREPLASLAADGPRVITGTDIWFAENPDARSVVITGTKGKSTTAALTAHLASAAGLRTALGGNIGVPLLELMEVSPDPDLWVIELSSYQIHGLRGRPTIAVILNLHPEHLDWHGSVERYYADKLSVLRGMKGTVILNREVGVPAEYLPGDIDCRFYDDPGAIHVAGDDVLEGDRVVFPLQGFRLPGAHNRSNLCAALTVLRVLGVDPARVETAVKTFEPLAHRLQSVGTYGGVDYVDDSISTTPRSALAALACYPDRPVVLLAGGHDRGVDWEPFAHRVADRDNLQVVTFGTCGRRIAGTLRLHAPEIGTHEARTLDEAVTAAADLAVTGGVVLLSPGAPSFDAFRDYSERGMRFAALARRQGR